MQVITATALRRALFATLQKVVDDEEPLVVTRAGAEPVAVVSAAYLSSLEETAHLLRSPANAQRLADSIAELDAGGGAAHELVDPQ